MKIKYDVENLRKLITCLSDLTGISVSVIDYNYNSLVWVEWENDFCNCLQERSGYREMCHACDKDILERCKISHKLEKNICHAGLYDFAMPIEKDGVVAAYILMGRIRSENSPASSKYSFDESEKLYKETGYLSEQQIEALLYLMPHIFFNSAIKFESDGVFEEIVGYINENLENQTAVSDLCRKFHISKNLLYGMFKKEFGYTVNEYKNSIRIKKAKELLINTDESVWAIAEKVGITNYPYFCRLFKKCAGVTALEYRAANKK